MSEEEIIKGIENIIYILNDCIEEHEWYNEEEIESAKEQLKFTERITRPIPKRKRKE